MRAVEAPPTDPMRTTAQQAGDAAETLVAGPAGRRPAGRVLARNVHVGRHELDLVAVDPGPPPALVIVEVRWRGSRGFGLPEETVDHRKRTRVRAAAYGLLERGALPDGRRSRGCRCGSTWSWSSRATGEGSRRVTPPRAAF